MSRIALLLSMLAAACIPSSALAESMFLLAWPQAFGRMPAATYDASGQQVGTADLSVQKLDSGHIRLRSESGMRDGARTVATAELAPVEPGHSLRLLFEESRSLDERGRPLGRLAVDHVRGRARCEDENGRTLSEVDLPERDRVVNVPLNLLFLPLVRGEKQSMEFQLFLCRPDARLMAFEAWVEGDAASAEGPIEVRYGPDLGMASFFARQMAPKLSFWFDPEAPHTWAAHRIPLYSGGPEVFVVRDDVSSTSLVH